MMRIQTPIHCLFMAVALWFSVTAVKGQTQVGKRLNSPGKTDVSPVVRAYTDSLAAVRQRMAADSAASKPSPLRSDMARLFLPTTFYHSLAHDFMDLHTHSDENSVYTSMIDKSLLEVYLKHPELVRNTETHIQQTGPAEQTVTAPIRNNADLVEKIADVPTTIDIVPMEVLVTKPNFWTIKGDYSLQIMQNFVSPNWHKGGESSYAMLGAITMEANYNNKQKVKWDNKLELKVGLQDVREDTVHTVRTTEDLIRLTSKLGLQATKHWYYTLQVIGTTQFAHSYKSNDRKMYADFMAPGKLNVSLGMDYNMDWMNHKLKGTVHLAPLAYNLIYTRWLELSTSLGVDEGKHAKHDFGSQLTVDFTWEITDIIKWKSRLEGYTTYKRALLEWENTFVLQLNKWLAAQLFLHPRFDDGVPRDDRHGYWQFKEFASIGFNYSF